MQFSVYRMARLPLVISLCICVCWAGTSAMCGTITYRPAEITFEPPPLTGKTSVAFAPGSGGMGLGWRTPQEIGDLFSIANTLHVESPAMAAACEAVENLDPDMQRKAVSVYQARLLSLPRTPPMMGEKLSGKRKMISCPLPASHRNLAWLLSCLGEPNIESLMSFLKTTRNVNWEARIGAAEALGWMGAAAVEPLVAELDHQLLQVRIRAAAALLQIGDTTTYPLILEALTPNDNGETEGAPNSAGTTEESAIIVRLISLLNHDEPMIRANAAWALGYIGVPGAVEPLLAYLERAEGFDIWFAAEPLGVIGDRRALEPLLEKARALGKKYPNSLVSYALALALARLGETAIDPLVSLLQDDSLKVYKASNNANPLEETGWYSFGARIAAARALGWIEAGSEEPKRSLGPLLDALSNTNENAGRNARVYSLRVQIAAIKALGQLGDTRAVEPLTRALDDEYYPVRACAAWALGQLSDPRGTEALLALFDDKSVSVRFVAISALSGNEDPRVFDAFLAMLDQSGVYSPRDQMIAEALAEMGPGAVDRLVLELENPKNDKFLKKEIITALGMMRAPGAVAPLVDFLGHKNTSIREATAWSLGSIGDPGAAPALVKALSDSKADVRRNATWALGTIGDPAAVGALIYTLNDTKEELPIRQNAAWALGRIGDPKATADLVEGLRDSDVGRISYWSLKRITGEDFGIGTTESIDEWEAWCNGQAE
jgi:HEAT repeat protein